MFLILLVVQLFLVPSALLNVVPDIQTSCHIPTVEFGQPTILTCNFGVNMQLFRQDFQIVHNGNDPVLTCLYDIDSPNCLVNGKYAFDYVITETVQLKIPEAKEHHNGSYICKYLGFEAGKFQMCVFNAKERTSSATSSSTSEFSNEFYSHVKPILTCLCDAETLDFIVNILYNFNYKISDTVSLSIDAATESHAGTYTCNVLDNETTNGENFTLSLRTKIWDSPSLMPVIMFVIFTVFLLKDYYFYLL